MKTPYQRHTIGQQAEDAACHYLKRQGLKLVHRRFHCRFGEIDLIMRDKACWVFVEVRCRADGALVSACESISAEKMRKIRKTAEFFLMQFDELPDCRFDVIAMSYSRDKIGYAIDWIPDAF